MQMNFLTNLINILTIQNFEKFICIILSTLLVIPFFFPPYWFFQFLRVTSFLGFSFLAFRLKENYLNPFFLLFILFAIIFQPIEKIALGKSLWLLVDTFAILVLIIYLIKNSIEKKP